MEYIITFKSTNFAIKAEKYLLEQQIKIGVMPLPSQINAGCGICLRLNKENIKQALNILADNNIDGIGLFTREIVNGKFNYKDIGDIKNENN